MSKWPRTSVAEPDVKFVSPPSWPTTTTFVVVNFAYVWNLNMPKKPKIVAAFSHSWFLFKGTLKCRGKGRCGSSKAVRISGFEGRSLSTPRSIWATTQLSKSANFQPPTTQATLTWLTYPRIVFWDFVVSSAKRDAMKKHNVNPPNVSLLGRKGVRTSSEWFEIKSSKRFCPTLYVLRVDSALALVNSNNAILAKFGSTVNSPNDMKS